MKNNILTSVLIALGVIVAVTACCPIVFAKNTEQPKTLHEKIERELTSIKNVKDTKVFLHEDMALIALRTQNSTNKTQTDEIKNLIKEFLAKNYPEYKNVKVTCSIKAFVAIERINSIIDSGEADLDDLLDKIPSPFPRPMPKPMPLPETPNK